MNSARLQSTRGMPGLGCGLGEGLMMAEVVASRLLRRNIVGGKCRFVADGLIEQAGASEVTSCVES